MMMVFFFFALFLDGGFYLVRGIVVVLFVIAEFVSVAARDLAVSHVLVDVFLSVMIFVEVVIYKMTGKMM